MDTIAGCVSTRLLSEVGFAALADFFAFRLNRGLPFDTALIAAQHKAVVSKGARRRPYIASGLMLAMTVVLATSCFALHGRTPEERACCASMGHDCGALAFERQCCSGEATKLQAVAPATVTIAVAAPAAVLVALLEEPSPVVRGLAVSMLHQGWPIKPPGDPTYLLNSILRI